MMHLELLVIDWIFLLEKSVLISGIIAISLLIAMYSIRRVSIMLEMLLLAWALPMRPSGPTAKQSISEKEDIRAL